MTFEERDLIKDPLDEDELKTLEQRFDNGLRDILSTRSRKYRELGLKDRDSDEAELRQLMGQEPTLIRRPIIIEGDETIVGYNAKRLAEVFGADE